MIQFIGKKIRNKKGFTLVELVVVIAILGILAAIAVPRLIGFQDRAKEQADKQVGAQVKNAVALLYANGELTFPTSSPADVTFRIASDGSVSYVGTPQLQQSNTAIATLLTNSTSGLIRDFKLQGTKVVEVKLTTAGAVESGLVTVTP